MDIDFKKLLNAMIAVSIVAFILGFVWYIKLDSWEFVHPNDVEEYQAIHPELYYKEARALVKNQRVQAPKNITYISGLILLIAGIIRYSLKEKVDSTREQ